MSCRFQTQFMQIPFWSQFVIWRKIRNKNFKMTWDDVSHMSLAHWMAAVNGGIGLKLAQLLSRNSPSPAKPGEGFWHLDAYNCLHDFAISAFIAFIGIKCIYQLIQLPSNFGTLGCQRRPGRVGWTHGNWPKQALIELALSLALPLDSLQCSTLDSRHVCVGYRF